MTRLASLHGTHVSIEADANTNANKYTHITHQLQRLCSPCHNRLQNKMGTCGGAVVNGMFRSIPFLVGGLALPTGR